MFNLQRGDLVPAAWFPIGGAITLLNIRSHNLDISALLFDVTSSGSGGLTARLAGKVDCAGTIQADYDLDLSPYLAVPAIVTAGRGFAYFYLSPTRFFQIPAVIEKVHYEVAVESEVKYSWDVKCDSRVGALVYPAA